MVVTIALIFVAVCTCFKYSQRLWDSLKIKWAANNDGYLFFFSSLVRSWYFFFQILTLFQFYSTIYRDSEPPPLTICLHLFSITKSSQLAWIGRFVWISKLQGILFYSVFYSRVELLFFFLFFFMCTIDYYFCSPSLSSSRRTTPKWLTQKEHYGSLHFPSISISQLPMCPVNVLNDNHMTPISDKDSQSNAECQVPNKLK